MYIEKPTGGKFELVPAGNHIAICYRFIDLGTQLIEWEGTKKTQRKVLISWEFPNELLTEGDYAGQPFTTGKKYTWSMNEKASLRHDLESWRGKAFTDDDFDGPNRFNIKNIVGKPCMISIVHETKGQNTYANIKSVAAIPKGLPVPAQTNPSVYFSLQKEFFDNLVLDGLSDKLKETIKNSPEFLELTGASQPSKQSFARDDLDDEVPF